MFVVLSRSRTLTEQEFMLKIGFRMLRDPALCIIVAQCMYAIHVRLRKSVDAHCKKVRQRGDDKNERVKGDEGVASSCRRSTRRRLV